MHWIALQPATEARAGQSTLAEALVDGRAAWICWALQFTPWVAQLERALVLEVSRSERLFGGRSALLQRLFSSDAPATEQGCAQGESALLALARLWTAAPEAPIDTLPLHSLMAAREHLPTLQRLGCRSWGQLRALPRAGLARRFGAGLLDALDCAYGDRPERYPWLTLPDRFESRLELSAAVESAEALLFGARRLLAQLQYWLRARQHGVLALELLWHLDARRANARHRDAHHNGTSQGHLVLRTAQATQDMQHLQRLLGEQLAQVNLPAPVLFLQMRTLQTQRLAGESQSLLPEEVRKGDSLHQTLERIGARLGAEQVQCVQPQARHSPEQMQVWVPWSPQPARPGTRQKIQMPDDAVAALDATLLPTWLLQPPQPLVVKQHCPQYYGPLTLLAGPQRLEAGWLEGDIALRDYFVARSAEAGLVWIYRERLVSADHPGPGTGTDRCWFLHGLFA